MPDESTPLLASYGHGDDDHIPPDPHTQFCMLVGVPPSIPSGSSTHRPSVPPKSLYGRVTRQLSRQRCTYYTTASLSNILLLTQVMLGAALTALGASASSHILITVFGAMNTVIAGLVAYLKSRGQPMRARMYRDDLERVVDEIENSEVMWLGISRHVHGYDEIDIDEHKVSVRSEVARLTRLYDRAIRSNTVNNPDMYMSGSGYEGTTAALRSKPVAGQTAAPLPVPAPSQPVLAAPVVAVDPGVPAATVPAPVQSVPDPDASPATAPPKPVGEPPKASEDEGKDNDKDTDKEEPKKADEGGDAQTQVPEQGDTGTDAKKGEPSSSTPPPSSTPEPPLAGPKQPGSSPPKPTPPPPPPPPQQVFDPDAAPASDPNVPIRKTPATTPNGETKAT